MLSFLAFFESHNPPGFFLLFWRYFSIPSIGQSATFFRIFESRHLVLPTDFLPDAPTAYLRIDTQGRGPKTHWVTRRFRVSFISCVFC